MPVDRPTFSETWYRVADLRPRLRATVQVHRQHFRGQLWYVLEDPGANQFFRINPAAYAFIGMLDGRRTVAEVWRGCNETLGDDAPTQGEAIELLGQLYTANLLSAELPPDAEGLFKRFRKRRVREIQGVVSNLLFLRLPILDPDRFLERWVGLFGWLFSWIGAAVWAVVVAAGLYFVIGDWNKVMAGPGGAGLSGVLAGENLLWLYLGMALVKVFHEFGHAFACKKLGRDEARAGEVHTMGVMLLVFMPMPYVDASSAWALRSKWRRVMVGAAGMYVELAVAAVAAIVWANAGPGILHDVCYNMMLVASVSTVLFNGNPLLRYDAYYILSDLLEIPNLAQRSKDYLQYLVKRYVWGVRRPRNPAHSIGERVWFGLYGPASTAYRIVIFSAILLYLTERLPKFLAVVAIAFGVVAAAAWIVVPLGKFVHYLFNSPELLRVRGRAMATTLVFAALVLAPLGVVKAPHHERIQAVVEPVRMVGIYARTDGFLEQAALGGQPVGPDGPVLVRCVNPALSSRREELLGQRRGLDVRRRQALTDEPAAREVLDGQIAALDQQLAQVQRDLDGLTITAPFAGRWISTAADRLAGAYLHRGDPLGLVADVDEPILRGAADQDFADMLGAKASTDVDVRIQGRPEMRLSGRVIRWLPAGSKDLPNPALGHTAGGATPTVTDEKGRTQSVERVFTVEIQPLDRPPPQTSAAEGGDGGPVRLLAGQRVIVRFDLPAKPLAAQWWMSLRRMFMRRFQI